MKMFLTFFIVMFSANVFSAETREVRMDYNCQLENNSGRELGQFDSEMKSGRLYLKDTDVLSQTKSISFINFESLCMRLERYETIDNVVFISHDCSEKNSFGPNGNTRNFIMGEILEGAIIKNEIKSKKIFGKKEILSCTFSNVVYE